MKVTKVLLMNIEKTIENIVAKCDNYIDPQLAICIIRDNCTMGSNNIGELKKYCFEIFRKTKRIDEAEAVKNWVVVGGTVTSMAAVLQQLEVYDAEKVQGYVMDQSKVTDLLDRLCHMSYDEKCNLPGMRPERADIIVAGVAILDSLMEYFAVSEVKVSDRDLSEGLLNADTMMPKD